MPVADHPVHESGKRSTATPYGCHNRPPMAKGYWVPDGQRIIGVQGAYRISESVESWIPHVTSTTCQYDKSHADARCSGCTHQIQA